MAVLAATADVLNKFQSIARNVTFSLNPASTDTITVAHGLTNAGGKGISYYQFRTVLRSHTTVIAAQAQSVAPPALDSWNGSLATFRVPVFAGSPISSQYDVICEDPHSITW